MPGEISHHEGKGGCRASNQHEYAEETLQLCLYALESAWHPSFKPYSRQCYLSFENPKNRPMFVALNRHMQSLSRRGLHRTALEVAKLTLSLDPDDPVGLLTCIDYYALLAKQPGFVLVRRPSSECVAGCLADSGWLEGSRRYCCSGGTLHCTALRCAALHFTCRR